MPTLLISPPAQLDRRREQRTTLLLGRLARLREQLRTSGDAVDLSTLQFQRALVLAPHPDDEVIGCGALIRQLVERGAAVTVVFVTHEGARSIVPHDPGCPVRRRVLESREALRELGVTSVEYLGLEERSLLRDPSAAGELEHEIDHLLARLDPDLVVAPGFGEMHPDHRAVCRAALLCVAGWHAWWPLAGDAAVALYEVWGAPACDAFLRVTPAAMEAKRRAMEAYASQTETADYQAIMLLLHETRGRTLPAPNAPAEGFRLLPGREAVRAHLLEILR
jgi:LmbE family N-acetylglucosaminyl deacetylase